MTEMHSAAASADAIRKLLGSDEFVQSLPVAVYCCDLDGVVRCFSRKAAELWGRTPTLGDPDFRFCGAVELYWPNGAPLPREETPMGEVLRTGVAARNQTVVIKRPDGSRITALVNIEPLFDDRGVQVGAVNCFQDITTTDPADTRARAIERSYQQMLEALPVAVYTTDAEGRITFFNAAAVELAGRRPEIGTDSWCVTMRLRNPDGSPLPHDECPMAVALKERRPIRGVQAIAERPDGGFVRFEAFPTPLFDVHGTLTGAVNMLMDVTARHQAGLELAHLAAIVASSDDAIVSKGLDGRIRSWNAGATRIFGWKADEMIGEPISTIIPSELHTEEADIIRRIRSGERIDHFETVRLTKDGRRIDISITISPIRDETGVVVGASKVARDITDRKRAEELQQLLIAELNHRVKNTLATVQAMANQTVRLAMSPADFAVSFSSRIKALAYAHDLLTRNSWRGADVHALARDQVLLEGADDDRVAISGPQVTLDPQPALHLAMVLHELGTNARKYGALSSPSGRLSLAWTLRSNAERILLLEWSESGGPPVVAPSKRGFGATLIEKSLAAHGGEAAVSYRAEGVTCEIRLPLPEREPARFSHADTQLLGAGGSKVNAPSARTPVAGRSILVVEDEPLVAMDLLGALVEAGAVVVGPAVSLDEAKRLIAAAEFDAALLDANLNGCPADELAATLLDLDIPFAFVTGYGRGDLPTAFRRSPMISKPFAVDQLLDVVGRLVSVRDNVVRLRPKRRKN